MLDAGLFPEVGNYLGLNGIMQLAGDTAGNLWAATYGNGLYRMELDENEQGPGLTEEDKKKIFGKFQRLSARPTGGEHSTGLGLSIVKKYVEAMDGRVWCESEAGKGANFIVEFKRMQ